MPLIVRALAYKGLPPAEEISARFESDGGAIGRSPENRLALPDPEKYISRLHATIHYENGQYFIQDSSAGGTYLERQGQLLQQGRALLSDGDTLRIGEYQLQVSIVETAPPSAQPFFEPARPVRQLDFADAAGPLAAPPTPAPVVDARQSFVEQPDASVFHESFTPPQAAPVKAESSDDLDFGDLLSTLDHLSSTAPSPKNVAASATLPVDFPALPDDFFSDDQPPAAEPAPPTAPLLAPFADHPDSHAPAEVEAEVVAVPPVPNRQLDAHVPPAPALDNAMPEMPPPPAVPPAPVAPPPAPAGVAATDSELVRAFLAGAGINDPQLLPPEQWPLLFHTTGELLRGMVDGLMCVLRARAELKSQFRVSVTTMRSVDNNPLKFTPNVDDALRLILAPTNPGFLAPKDAVREGFADIMNHQVAMTAGIQAALADVLRDFDPALIEQACGEGLLFQKKAKCWERYSAQYPKLKEAAQEAFFGDAFGDAYEQQMQLLSRSSKR